MDPKSPITAKTVLDTGKLLTLINSLKITRKRFVQNRHGGRVCDCLNDLPSLEEIDRLDTEIKAIRELCILVFKLQAYGAMPTMCNLIRTKIGDTILRVEILQNVFVSKAVSYGFKVIITIAVNH